MSRLVTLTTDDIDPPLTSWLDPRMDEWLEERREWLAEQGLPLARYTIPSFGPRGATFLIDDEKIAAMFKLRFG